MKQKLFLSSMLIMSVAPAMAETFPTNGLMQENTTYTNAATETNMDGVYEGTVNATAEYTDILYNIVAGNYLAAGSEDENGTQCPAGSWCPGLTNVTYDEDNAQGINTCPSEYGLSAAGASSQNDCYRTCTTADVEHSASVTGGYYYGNNNQCGAASCVNGWHIKPGFNVSTAVGTDHGVSQAWINNGNTFTENSASYGQSFYGISGSNTWADNYGNNGIVIGQARCSTRAGAEGTWTSNYNVISDNFVTDLTDETGQTGAQYCYCNVTGYKASSSADLQSLSSSWLFSLGYNDALSCASACADRCARPSSGPSSNLIIFRTALFGTVAPGLASCEANTITINWNGTTQEAINANNAGTATYGSDVRTPVSATPVKGKTFKGWRFSKPQQVQSCNNITNQSTCESNSGCAWDIGNNNCVQLCESITDENDCYNREGRNIGPYMIYEHCEWDNGSCVSIVESVGNN